MMDFELYIGGPETKEFGWCLRYPVNRHHYPPPPETWEDACCGEFEKQ